MLYYIFPRGEIEEPTFPIASSGRTIEADTPEDALRTWNERRPTTSGKFTAIPVDTFEQYTYDYQATLTVSITQSPVTPES